MKEDSFAFFGARYIGGWKSREHNSRHNVTQRVDVSTFVDMHECRGNICIHNACRGIDAQNECHASIMYVYMYVYIYVYMYVYMYVYIYVSTN